jgi:Fe-S cluster assembly ATP-binding protein
MSTLEIKDLHVSIETEQGTKEILKGVSLTIRTGETHAIMGPNGSGKSTLASTIAGHPRYNVTSGSITLDGEDVLEMSVDERARAGVFLAMQYPVEVPGVSVVNFLRTAYKAVKAEEISALAFRKHMKEKMNLLGVEDAMVNRYVNQGFSGGEKKKNEILQLAVLEPDIAVLDETDSGLDIDSLKAVAMGVEHLIGPDLGVLLITHYQRILNYVTPDFVHVMIGGRIVKSGGQELAHELEEKGYEGIRQELGIEQENGERGA